MAQLRLHQLVALNKDAKSHGESVYTKAYHATQRREPLSGLLKTYEPLDSDGQQLPSEGVKLQARVEKIIQDMVGPMARQLDLAATVEGGNQVAHADVVVDGVIIISDASVGFLMGLEKKLVGASGLASFIEGLPVLDPSVNWEYDDSIEAYKSEPSQKTRSDKVPVVLERSPATPQHKAETEVLFKDKVVGIYTTVLYSGAIDAKRKRELADKVRKLAAAVKIAREEANSVQVEDVNVGTAIFDYLSWGTPVTG